MYDLKGKVALITGAARRRSLGCAIALRLAEEGADVVVNDVASGGGIASRPPSLDWGGLPNVVRDIEALGRRALGVVADVGDAQQVDRMVAQALESFGQIDILVNSAGAAAGPDRVPVVDLSEDAWDLVQRVNVKGTFLCCRAVAREMIALGRGGKIINMSSVSGKRGVARYGAYCASKFAVRGLTQVLALELAPYHITVNAICPAWIESDRIDDMAAALAPQGVSRQEYREEMVARVIDSTPLGRIGQPEDVAQMVAYLVSAESEFLTGLSITVAGGSHLD